MPVKLAFSVVFFFNVAKITCIAIFIVPFRFLLNHIICFYRLCTAKNFYLNYAGMEGSILASLHIVQKSLIVDKDTHSAYNNNPAFLLG